MGQGDALRQDAELFQGMFNQAAVGIAITGPDRKVVRANRKICDFLGCKPDEIVGKLLRDATHPDFLPLVDEQIRKLADGEVESGTIEALYLRKDGVAVWGEWTSSIIRDDFGRPKYFISVIQNIDERKKAEAEAKKTREMLEHSERVAHLGSWELDLATFEERWSDEAYRIYGLEPQSIEVDGYGFLEYVHPEDRERAKRAQDDAIAKRQPFSIEYRLIPSNDVERIVHEHAELEYDKKGNPTRLSGTIQDITELKQAEANLREVSRRLEQAQKQAKVGYWRWSFEKECLTYWSEEAARISQYPVGDSLKTYPEMLAAVHPDDRRRVQAEYKEADEQSRDFSLEYRVVHEGGRITHIREIGEVEYDENGAPIAHVGFVQDITELKQMEEELRRSEQRLNAFFEDAPAGLTLYDREGRYIKANKTIAQINGTPVEAHIGKLPSEILPEGLGKAIDEANQRTLETGEKMVNVEISAPIPVSRTDPGHFVYSRFPISSPEGEVLGVGAVIVDITERKQAEEALARLNSELEQRVEERTAELRVAQDELLRRERLATLGQLTATVSHELRNPLGAMRSSMYVVEAVTENRDERFVTAIQRVNRSIQRCDQIIDELLDYTRIRDLEVTRIDLDDWVGGVIDELPVPEGILVERLFGGGGIEVPADTDRLRRAIINIYDNACQAMTEQAPVAESGRRPHLTVQTAIRENWAEIIFTDNGPGIPEDEDGKIFEPLFSTKNFGVGLGLPVVKQIMEQHEGGVDVAAAPGGGARFTLWLPLRRNTGFPQA
jgi:PAS domain S-box-containing protein